MNSMMECKEWIMPNNLYKDPVVIDKIKKVLVINCSARCEKGATGAVTDKFAAGMIKAGAEVLYPARMNILPCIGCSQCWANNTNQVYLP